jgi:hypothetical protein
VNLTFSKKCDACKKNPGDKRFHMENQAPFKTRSQEMRRLREVEANNLRNLTKLVKCVELFEHELDFSQKM